jgi:hypothetical protein
VPLQALALHGWRRQALGQTRRLEVAVSDRTMTATLAAATAACAAGVAASLTASRMALPLAAATSVASLASLFARADEIVE